MEEKTLQAEVSEFYECQGVRNRCAVQSLSQKLGMKEVEEIQ